jgi:putative membrane-bound dehydrogenase-like protein
LEWTFSPNPGKPTQYEVKFRDGTKGIVHRMTKDVRDVLKTLADTNGDGRYDRATMLMNDLELPSTVLLHDGWIYLASVGRVIRRKPAPGGQWVEEEIVRGLSGYHQHQVSGLALTHDGWLLISSGDDDNRGEGSDGSRAIVLRTGAILRCRPDGSQLHEFARGFCNPYRDVAFDEYFNIFHADNDQEDGSRFQGVRLIHVQEGADYGWRLAEGASCCRTDVTRAAVFGERPGKMPAIIKTGRGAPAGLLVYQGMQFPDFFRGLVIYPDVVRQQVRAYRLEREGSTFKVTQQFVLMQSADPLFRPCQAVTGPDGAIYLVDWRTESTGEGRLCGDGVHGRIYRLSWSGTPAAPAIALAAMNSWARLTRQTDAALFKLLDSPDGNLRLKAQRELVRRGEKHRQGLIDVAKDVKRPGPARTVAIGGACAFYNASVQEAMLELLHDENFEIRRLAADAIGRHGKLPGGYVSALGAELGEPHPAARRARAMMMGNLATRLAPDDGWRGTTAGQFLDGLLEDDRKDRFMVDSYVRGLELIGPFAMAEVLAQLSIPEERELGVSLLEAMRTKDAAEALDQAVRRDASQLTDDQLRRLFVAYRNIQVEPPISAAAVAQWLAEHPRAPLALRIAALETVGLVGGAEPDQLVGVARRLLDHPDSAARLAATRAIADVGLVSLAPALVKALGNATRTTHERREIVAALGQLRSRPAPITGTPGPPGVELVLDELVALAVDPQHAEVQSELLSLVAQVDFAKSEPLATKLLDSSQPAAVAAAIDVLGARKEHAVKIAERFLAGQIAKDHLARVASALRPHAAKEPAGQAADLLKQVNRGALLVPLDPAELRRVEDLVARQGNPHRGLGVYLAERTACARCHKLEGMGGQIGPDLTTVWETHTVARLMESMIDPSREINPQFAAWTVTTTAGQVYQGLLLADTPQDIVLRDASGKDVRISSNQLAEKAPSQMSLMPEGVLAQLTLEEFIDLVAFLKDRQTQESLRGMAREVWRLGPLADDAHVVEAIEKNPNPQHPVELPQGRKLLWERWPADAQGRFVINQPAGVSADVVLALGRVYSPRKQDLEFALWTSGQATVQINDQRVKTPSGALSGERIRVPLQPGRNRLLVRFGGAPGGFYLRLQSLSEGLRFSAE